VTCPCRTAAAALGRRPESSRHDRLEGEVLESATPRLERRGCELSHEGPDHVLRRVDQDEGIVGAEPAMAADRRRYTSLGRIHDHSKSKAKAGRVPRTALLEPKYRKEGHYHSRETLRVQRGPGLVQTR